jgi:hypothetical protein
MSDLTLCLARLLQPGPMSAFTTQTECSSCLRLRALSYVQRHLAFYPVNHGFARRSMYSPLDIVIRRASRLGAVSCSNLVRGTCEVDNCKSPIVCCM